MKLNNVISIDCEVYLYKDVDSEFVSMDSSALVINFSLQHKGCHFHLRLDVEVTISKHSIISSRYNCIYT